MTGLRLALNDEQSTEILAGVTRDADDSSTLFSLEASRRLKDRWKLTMEAVMFSRIDGTTGSMTSEMMILSS